MTENGSAGSPTSSVSGRAPGVDGDDAFRQGCLLHVLPPATRRNAQCCGASRDPLALQRPHDGCIRAYCGSSGLSVFVSLTFGRSSQQARRTAGCLAIVTQILSRDSAEQFVVEYPAQPGAFTYSPRGVALGPCSSMGPAATYTWPAGRFLVCDRRPEEATHRVAPPLHSLCTAYAQPRTASAQPLQRPPLHRRRIRTASAAPPRRRCRGAATPPAEALHRRCRGGAATTPHSLAQPLQRLAQPLQRPPPTLRLPRRAWQT